MSPSVRNPGHTACVRYTYIGRLESEKGIEDLLTAIDSDSHHGEWTICGAGRFDSEVKARSNIVYFDYLEREEISQLLSKTDVFVLPSLSEGMSTVVLEAMAAGCAIVARDSGGIAEYVRDGVNGILFNCGKSGLISAIDRLSCHPELIAKMAVHSSRLASQYSAANIIPRYDSLYKAI